MTLLNKDNPYIDDYYSWSFTVDKPLSKQPTRNKKHTKENFILLGKVIKILKNHELANSIRLSKPKGFNDVKDWQNFTQNYLKLHENLYKDISIKITCNGYIYDSQNKSFHFDNIISIILESTFSLSFDINVNHLAFLPCNPKTGAKQYDVWKHNASRLAKALQEIDSIKNELSCINDMEFFTKKANCVPSNIFYLSNMPYYAYVKHFEDDAELDEAPLHLLSSQDVWLRPPFN
ncbi:hypothetical protein [Microscilla marina]|uniref:Uncharacterized protein n=1 Tax=Microscilla marina ATCC 23134 TaxID=313606 RepID=A1ZEK2_MICM2|nr:hypothetical protein [Microscilla marina]EAY30954.1 hypothetical protein M23134_07361 [Microscilla marina ATCC 23134]